MRASQPALLAAGRVIAEMRDSLRAWTMTRGYETTGRPFENWTNGVDAGFTDEGQFQLCWGLK